MGTPSMGSLAQMAFDSALPIDGSSIPIEFKSESLSKTGTIVSPEGIRGTRSHASERTRTGPYTCSGTITMAVSRVALDNFLPCIMGAAESTNVFNPAETLTEFQLMIDRGARRFTYTGCTVNKATFRGSAGGLLELSMDIEADTEVVESDAFPSLTMPTDKPYILKDGVLTMQAATREFSEFEITIDNVLNTSRFMNAGSRAQIPSQDRIVTFSCATPYSSDEVALYNQALAGAAASLVFTNSEEASSVLTFAFATLQFPDQSPVVANKDEIPLRLNGVARKASTTAELVITNAHA